MENTRFVKSGQTSSTAPLDGRINLPKDYDGERCEKTHRGCHCSRTGRRNLCIMYTLPAGITGVPKKVPDLMETKVSGGTIEQQYEFATGLLGKEVSLNNVIQTGAYADVTAITTGKGTQGPVKRWGVALRKRKHCPWRKKATRRHSRSVEPPSYPVAGSPDGSDGIPAEDRVQQAYP